MTWSYPWRHSIKQWMVSMFDVQHLLIVHMHICFITEILESESVKDLFYIILVLGNMINAVSYILCILCCIAIVIMYREGIQVVHMALLSIHWTI